MVSLRSANLPPTLDRAGIIIVLAPSVTVEPSKARSGEDRARCAICIRTICCLVEDTRIPYEVHAHN